MHIKFRRTKKKNVKSGLLRMCVESLVPIMQQGRYPGLNVGIFVTKANDWAQEVHPTPLPAFPTFPYFTKHFYLG